VVSVLDSVLAHHTVVLGNVEVLSAPVHVQAVEIVSVDGQPVGPNNFAARDLVTEIAALNPGVRPDEIGTPWPIQSPGFFSDQSSAASINLAFEMPGANSGAAAPAVMDYAAGSQPAAAPAVTDYAAGSQPAAAPAAASYPAASYPAATYPAASAPAASSPAAGAPGVERIAVAGTQPAAANLPAGEQAAAQQLPAQPATTTPTAPASGSSAVGEQLAAQGPGALGGGSITVSSPLLTSGQETFAARLAQLTGLSPRVCAAWALAEESGSAAQGRQAASNFNWLNIGYFDSGPGQIAFNKAFADPVTAAEQTANFLKGGWGGASSSIRAILSSVGQRPEQQIAAIANSDWASSHYFGGASLRGTYDELGGMTVQSSGGN
jgi:hypothetical protein